MTSPVQYPAFDGTQPCRTVDPEAFFPELGERTERAKAICHGGILGYPRPCPFLEPCLDYALHHHVSGVWGGTSGQQRRVMRNRLGIVAAPLSFGSGPTNATVAKRMAGRGTPVVEIAAHLGITHEAVHRILRAENIAPPQRKGVGVEPRTVCEDCGNKLMRKSMGRHKRDVCGRQVAS